MKVIGVFKTTALAALVVSGALPAQAATITGWNTDNVEVGATPSDGVTGASVVYDGAPTTVGASSSGQIVFTPPEAISPGIQVTPETYTQGGPSGITLDGCIMTSNPGATCTSEFQSGKRIKQQATGFDPVDLVFDVAAGDETSIYQVFGRLINVTGKALSGFEIELGFGVGTEFVSATISDAIKFSTDFKAQPTGVGSSGTQFPFGLFGDASTNKNFVIDGFFDDERSGLALEQTETKLTSGGYFGAYESMFGPWMTQGDAQAGLFWDFDNDDDTDGLLMAWEYAPDMWELRREAVETCDPIDTDFCSPASTLDTYVSGLTFDEVVSLLGVDIGYLDVGAIEDLANLNLNYAIELGDLGQRTAFTIRTTVYEYIAPVPLPASGLLMVVGLGGFAALRRRKRLN